MILPLSGATVERSPETGPARQRVFSILLVLLSFPSAAVGEELKASFQHDPVEYYGSRILAWVLILGICVICYSLLRFRGRTVGPVSWGLLILGIGILPVLSLSFGGLLVLERAERVEFCGSCHLVMRAYVDDLKNPMSESLSAIHFKNRYIPSNQCYVCHTSYGLFGTLQAKIEGMIDVYKYYTHTYRLPIKMRKAYPNTDCLKCHGGSVKWERNHEDCRDAVFGGETGCFECHQAATPPHTLAAIPSTR
jgi:cytochrome c nitrite reductase small subunit